MSSTDSSQFPAGVALIFGATGGIGAGVAREFARAGSDVAVVWHSKEDRATELVTELQGLACNTSTHQCDVRDSANVAKTIAAAIEQHGRIHTLVWGAGPLVEQVDVADVSKEQWQQSLDIEVNGFYTAAKAVISHMRDAGGGSLVHLGSAGDLRWPEKDVLSVAPKAANEALITGFAREEGKHNIRANSVLIGVIEAGMFLELTKQGVFDEQWVAEVHKNLALKRWGQAEEVGHAAVFLASNKAAYVTGQQIAVAGGYGI